MVDKILIGLCIILSFAPVTLMFIIVINPSILSFLWIASLVFVLMRNFKNKKIWLMLLLLPIGTLPWWVSILYLFTNI